MIRTTRQRREAIIAAVTVLVVIAAVVGLTLLGTRNTSAAADTGATPAASSSGLPSGLPSGGSTAGTSTLGGKVDNVVFILADDMDWNLFNQVPRLTALRGKGLTLTNLTVTDSLCCPSRSSILRSQYVHSHKVVSNLYASGGGFPKFYLQGLEKDCLGTWLHDAGVHTGFVGKYLNEYPDRAPSRKYVPPGWDDWVSPVDLGHAYSGYGYTLNVNGTLEKHGKKPRDLINNVLTNQAVKFIATSPDHFYLQLNTFTPHDPSPVAKQYKGIPAPSVPRTPSYNAKGINEPAWLNSVNARGPLKRAEFDKRWQQRYRSVQSIADSVDAVTAALTATGRLDKTMIIIGSDNGYHMGFHRLPAGKRTAFKEDTVVPYVFIGPGATPGGNVDAMTSTVDLGPTIASFLGARTPAFVEGRDLSPFFTSLQTPADWRTAALSESMSESAPGDPDYSTFSPPRFAALRSNEWVYIEYANSEKELYNRATDPDEMHNLIGVVNPLVVDQLAAQLHALQACSGASCRVADAMPQPAMSLSIPSPSSSASATAGGAASSTATSTASPSASATN